MLLTRTQTYTQTQIRSPFLQFPMCLLAITREEVNNLVAFLLFSLAAKNIPTREKIVGTELYCNRATSRILRIFYQGTRKKIGS